MGRDIHHVSNRAVHRNRCLGSPSLGVSIMLAESPEHFERVDRELSIESLEARLSGCH